MSESKEKPAEPRNLREAGAELWRQIVTGGAYELRPDELRVLEDACREADLIDAIEVQLSAGIANGDFTVRGSQGQPVINPLISEQRQHRSTLASLLAKLKLPDEGGEAQQPRGVQQRSAAQSRWNKTG